MFVNKAAVWWLKFKVEINMKIKTEIIIIQKIIEFQCL